MNETEIKNRIVIQLKQRGCKVTRFEDRFTANIPDMLIYGKGSSSFVEVKYAENNLAFPWKWKSKNLGQAVSISQLQYASGIPCWYFAYGGMREGGLLLPAATLVNYVNENKPLIPSDEVQRLHFHNFIEFFVRRHGVL